MCLKYVKGFELFKDELLYDLARLLHRSIMQWCYTVVLPFLFYVFGFWVSIGFNVTDIVFKKIIDFQNVEIFKKIKSFLKYIMLME